MPFSGPLSWSWGKTTLPIHNNGYIPFICHDNHSTNLWNTFRTRLRYFSGPFVLVRRWNNQSNAHLRLKAFMHLLGHGNRPDYVCDTRRAARLLMDPLLATDGETTSHYISIVAQLKDVISNLNFPPSACRDMGRGKFVKKKEITRQTHLSVARAHINKTLSCDEKTLHFDPHKIIA